MELGAPPLCSFLLWNLLQFVICVSQCFTTPCRSWQSGAVVASTLPCNDLSLIALICVFTHSLENEKSRQLHGGEELRCEPQARGRGRRAAEHLLSAAPGSGCVRG